MLKHFLFIALVIALLSVPALAQTNSGLQRASLKSCIYTISDRSAVVPLGISSFENFAAALRPEVEQNRLQILVEPTGPVGLNSPFQFKSDMISVSQPNQPLNVPEKTYELAMTPVAISPNQVSLQVRYNNIPAFVVDLHQGEIFTMEVTVPGQKNRMFLSIAANDAQ